MDQSTKTSDVLNRAADLIEERGWGTGPAAMFAQSGVCVMGAICHAAVGDPDSLALAYVKTERTAAHLAVKSYLGISRDLWVWNDDLPDDTGERTVVEVLRATAVIEAARENEAAEVSA